VGLIKNESGKSKRRYEAITINNNGKLTCERTHVAKFF